MLDKIFGAKTFPANAKRLVTALMHDGWKETGTSEIERTRVFWKPYAKSGEPSAIRVNTSYDFAFYNYAQLCLHRPSLHFQKIQAHGFLDDGVTHVTLTERLHPVPAISRASEPLKTELKAFWQAANSYVYYCNEDGRKFTDEEEFDLDYLGKAVTADELTVHTDHLRKASQSLADAYVLLQQCQLWLYAQNVKFSDPHPDFNPDNIMIRKTKDGAKTLVMADPLSIDNRQTEYYEPPAEYYELVKAFGQPPNDVKKLFRIDI